MVRGHTYLTTGVILNILNYGLSIKSENRTCVEPSVEDNYSHRLQPTFLLNRNKDCLLWSHCIHRGHYIPGSNTKETILIVYALVFLFLIPLYFLRSADGLLDRIFEILVKLIFEPSSLKTDSSESRNSVPHHQCQYSLHSTIMYTNGIIHPVHNFLYCEFSVLPLLVSSYLQQTFICPALTNM